ncbi:MAG: hypothetical protein U0939_18250 [Pirellulales bacterium]
MGLVVCVIGKVVGRNAPRLGLALLACLWGSSTTVHAAPPSDPSRDVSQLEEPLLEWPLSNAAHASRWKPLHDVGRIAAQADGMRIEIQGEDPYIASPRHDFPEGERLQLRLRLRSETGGTAQVFYYQDGPREAQSVRFGAPAGESYEALLPLPPLGPRTQFRFDPPGASGVCVLERFAIERPLSIEPPGAGPPTPFTPAAGDRVLTSGPLTLRHAADRWHDFSVSYGDRLLAVAHNRPRISYLAGRTQRWTTPQKATVDATAQELAARTQWTDEEGATWRIEQRFRPARTAALQVVTRVTVDQPRRIAHLPTLVLMAGLGSFERRKSQALLAGVEYLEEEPSSSTADLEGPAALRRVPAAHKLTMPLMAIQHEGLYLALRWKRDPAVAALFDSPDRIWNSASHVLGLLTPGADPRYRFDGQPGVHQPWTLAANQTLEVQAELWAGEGRTVVPAVESYVAAVGMPPQPTTGTADDYVRQTLAGWLDTPLRDGARFRHAVGNGFGSQPAADAAWMLDWLGDAASDDALRSRARAAAAEALAATPDASLYHSHVGHLKPPVVGLVFDKFDVTRAQAAQLGRNLLNRFNAQGEVELGVNARGIDFARTHSSRTANGLTAEPLVRLLEAVLYAGDRELLAKALERLEVLSRYDGTVPRGAQTWEIPLHTPDILASAHLVKASVLAYRATGQPEWLARAKYWAWTGVPFVYLDPPISRGVGAYATIAVLGATQWEAPVWIGLPVQWCGLVYAESLTWLAPHDPEGPWTPLIAGITRSAMQQNYPLGHRHQGLLPDSFDLVAQSRNPADINPGTLQPLAMHLWFGRPAYDVQVRPGEQQWLSVAGQAATTMSTPEVWETILTPWSSRGSTAAVHGWRKPPNVFVDGRPADGESLRFDASSGTLTLRLPSAAPVRVRFEHKD